MSFRQKILAFALVALGAGALGMAFLGDKGIREVRRLQAERQRLSAEISQLRERTVVLEKEIQELRENPRAIEARARRHLGMIKTGETVFLLPENHGPRQ